MRESHNLINTGEFITTAPPGTLSYDVAEFGTSGPKTIFLLKEEQSRLWLIPENTMHIEFRSSFIQYEGVALMPLMLKLDNNPNLLFRGWFNYYESVSAKKYFTYLASQDKIYLLVFSGELEPERLISMSNNLQLWFKTHLSHLSMTLPWSLQDYEYAKSKIDGKYPTNSSLWKALGEKGINK